MNKGKPTVEKIKSTSRILAVLFKIARILCFVGIGVLSAGTIYIMIFGNIDLLVLGGKVILHSPFSKYGSGGLENWEIVFKAVAGIVSFILLAILFTQARDIFKDISIDSSPFEIKHVRRIRKIAIFYFVVSLIGLQSFDLSFSYSMNLVGIVGAVMFWCVSLIFEYGCELQQESDETL